MFASIALSMSSPATLLAADCGDTAGGGGSRVACACGDTVVTDTVLAAADPVVLAACVGLGLMIEDDGVGLDCAGRHLVGDGSDHGIFVKSAEGASVRRCEVSGFEDGIRVSSGGGNGVYYNYAHDNVKDGIAVRNGNKNRLKLNHSANNGDSGIDLLTASGTIIYANRLSGNAESGMELRVGSNENSIRANSIKKSLKHGIRLESGSNSNWISLNWVAQNVEDGIFVKASTKNQISWNATKYNGGDGLRLREDSHENSVRGHVSIRNGGDGICTAGIGNSVSWSTAIKNDNDGFQNDEPGAKNTYYRNYSRANAGWGFNDLSTDGGTAGTANRYARNRCRDNVAGKSDPAGLCY